MHSVCDEAFFCLAGRSEDVAQKAFTQSELMACVFVLACKQKPCIQGLGDEEDEVLYFLGIAKAMAASGGGKFCLEVLGWIFHDRGCSIGGVLGPPD